MTTFNPKHLAPETPAETIGRLATEGAESILDMLTLHKALSGAVLDTLIRVMGHLRDGATDAAAQHLSTVILLLDERWVDNGVAIRQYGEQYAEGRAA